MIIINKRTSEINADINKIFLKNNFKFYARFIVLWSNHSFNFGPSNIFVNFIFYGFYRMILNGINVLLM